LVEKNFASVPAGFLFCLNFSEQKKGGKVNLLRHFNNLGFLDRTLKQKLLC